MPILVGIDGTGTGDDAEYAATFRNGFVRTICGKPSPNTKYFRGPTTLGGGLMPAINNGFYFILNRLEQDKNAPIIMTGYSRGGAGVIEIARRLGLAKIRVKALILFDAVDRHAEIDTTAIPTTVENVLHLRRDPRTKSRISFGNCGVAHFPPTNYLQDFFMCTHGGMGGTPWTLPPGKSLNDFVDEGFKPGIQAGSPVAGSAINMGLRIVAPLPLKPLIGHGIFDSTRYIDGITNVTYMQDQAESKKVWHAFTKYIENPRLAGLFKGLF
jgi:hypothetical protein